MDKINIPKILRLTSKYFEEEHSEVTFISILKENWLHARHVEIERRWFANIYAIIIVALSAYMGESGVDVLPLYALLIISIVWLCITLKQNAEFRNHINAIQNIFNNEKITLGEKGEWRIYMGMPLSAKGGIYKVFRVSNLLVLFYSLISIASISFIIYILFSRSC